MAVVIEHEECFCHSTDVLGVFRVPRVNRGLTLHAKTAAEKHPLLAAKLTVNEHRKVKANYFFVSVSSPVMTREIEAMVTRILVPVASSIFNVTSSISGRTLATVP